MEKKDEVMTIAEVAEMLCVSVSQIRRLIKNAGLPHFQFVDRGQLHFFKHEVSAWRGERKVGQ